MTIHTVSKTHYEIINSSNESAGSLTYDNEQFSEATIKTTDRFKLQLIFTDVWAVFFNDGIRDKVMSNIRATAEGNYLVRLFYLRKKYLFNNIDNSQTSFRFLTAEGEELLKIKAIINTEVNWYFFSLYLNDADKSSYDPLLALLALHCANCSLGIMNGEPAAH